MEINKSVRDLHEDLKNGSLSVQNLVDSCKKIISERDPEIHALLGFYSDTLINDQISKAKKMFEEGKDTMLTGIPVVLKDNILVEGERATGGSKILENYVATYDATVVKNLKDAGAILLARGNMDEFAMGSSTENSAYGVTKNPNDLARVAGGSSGGSAAVVAYGGVPLALGSETGGSIREPAGFCGVVGLKTTYDTVSRYGLMAMGSSLDQIGPFGKTVDDVEQIYKIISSYDPMDSTSVKEEARAFDREFKKVIGVPRDFINREGIDKEVLLNFNESLEKMRELGYTIKDISIPHIEKSLSVYYIIVPAEISSNLARYDGIRYGLSVKSEDSIEGYFKTRTLGFGDEVRRRILLGTYVLSSGYYDAYYNKAQMVKEVITKEIKKIFDDVDLIATPTSPTPAFLIGEKANDPLAMYLADIFTVPVNISGVPAIALPSGRTNSGLPLSMQFIAPHFGEKFLFESGRDLEKIVSANQ